MREREAALLERADVVFAGGAHALREPPRVRREGALPPERRRVRAFRSRRRTASAGRDVERARARICRGDRRAAGLRADRCARRRVPRGSRDPRGTGGESRSARLPQRPNVHYTGRLPYGALPSLLAGVDVALMPFAINRATAVDLADQNARIFAARKPVVSTPIADVVAAYGDIAYIARRPTRSSPPCARRYRSRAERIERGVAAAAGQTWDAVFARMWGDARSREEAIRSTPRARCAGCGN